MSIIPIITAKEMVSVLLKAGFKIIRQEGSHIRFHHSVKKKSTTVALHIGDITRKVLKKILTQADISVDEFLKLLGKK
jgi:predicted RNA binding protein YcfA (HicA-like mRNA interferase family)